MPISNLVPALTGLIFGLLVGVVFGALQSNARRRHERRQEQRGNLNNGWRNVPGSMQRVALLLGTLSAAQLLWPALFGGAGKWFVSGGLVIGYGWMLYLQLRQRRLTA